MSVIAGYVGRLISSLSKVADTNQQNGVVDAYGLLRVNALSASDAGASDEGSYYTSSNGVVGAPIAGQTTNSPNTLTPSDVAPELVIENNNAVGGKNIVLRRIVRVITNPGTASQTGISIQCQLDAGLLYTSGGTALVVKNQNPLGPTSGALAWAGAIVKAAKVAPVYCGRSSPRSTLAIINDELYFDFGSPGIGSSTYAVATVAGRFVIPMPPVVIPPQYTWSMHFAYGLTVTGSPTSDWEVGHIER